MTQTWPVGERSILPSVLGLSATVALAIATGLTVLGVLVDLMTKGTLGLAFTVLYVAGCVLAVAWVRRDGLFGPMVAPPLLLAFAVPAVVLIAGDPKPGTGMAERLLQIGAPLVNAFPTMAGTTAAGVALGLFRMATQRIRRTPSLDKKPAPAGEPVRRDRPSATRERPGATEERRPARGSSAAATRVRRERDAARGAARRPASPRRS